MTFRAKQFFCVYGYRGIYHSIEIHPFEDSGAVLLVQTKLGRAFLADNLKQTGSPATGLLELIGLE